MKSDFSIEWIDRGREPQWHPDPRYPKGIVVDLSNEAADACCVDLPYPAKRCGLYIVVCRKCGLSTGVTTAGRSDDPRSLTVPCKRATESDAAQPAERAALSELPSPTRRGEPMPESSGGES